MSILPDVLLSFSDDNFEMTGDPVRADGWYGRGDHLYTVSISVSNFQGTVHIEGCLTTNPTSEDWFDAITPVVFGLGNNIRTTVLGETATLGYTFQRNVTFLRARLSRTGYVIPPENTYSVGLIYGVVDRVLLKR